MILLWDCFAKSSSVRASPAPGRSAAALTAMMLQPWPIHANAAPRTPAASRAFRGRAL